MCDWIHCNKCAAKFSNSILFYLTECGHILCQRCAERIKQTKKCSVCDKTTSTIQLCKEMDSTVQQFFYPFDSFLQKAMEIHKFQNQHITSYLQFLQHKYNFAKKQCIECHNTNKKLKKENQLLKCKLHGMGYDVNNFVTSTPAPTIESTPGLNFSVVSSIRCTPKQIIGRRPPGCAQRTLEMEKHCNPAMNPFTAPGSSHGPSPAQMVPNVGKRYLAPIHRTNTAQNIPEMSYVDVRGLVRGYPKK